jgi:hypothetical protein
MASPIVFPTYLQSEASKYQFVQLSVRDGKDKNFEAYSIFLPIPPGFQLGDSGEYSTIQSTAIDVLGAVSSPDADANKFASLFKIGIAKAATSVKGDLTQFGLKQIKSPNTNTTFTGKNPCHLEYIEILNC